MNEFTKNLFLSTILWVLLDQGSKIESSNGGISSRSPKFYFLLKLRRLRDVFCILSNICCSFIFVSHFRREKIFFYISVEKSWMARAISLCLFNRSFSLTFLTWIKLKECIGRQTKSSKKTRSSTYSQKDRQKTKSSKKDYLSSVSQLAVGRDNLFWIIFSGSPTTKGEELPPLDNQLSLKQKVRQIFN